MIQGVPEAEEVSELWIGTEADLTVSYSDVQGGQAAAHLESGGVLTWSAGNINQDPLFTAEDDYHLIPDSPCGNAATDAGITEDIEGTPRPQGDGFSMGAYEVAGTAPPPWGAASTVGADSPCASRAFNHLFLVLIPLASMFLFKRRKW